MELTEEQFDLLYTRRSQEDLKLVIEVLENEGSISVPADSPALSRAKLAQEQAREADKAAGGKGETDWEKRKRAFEAEAKEREKIAKENEKLAKERERNDKEQAGGSRSRTTDDKELATAQESDQGPRGSKTADKDEKGLSPRDRKGEGDLKPVDRGKSEAAMKPADRGKSE